jgi:hypothetical protein
MLNMTCIQADCMHTRYMHRASWMNITCIQADFAFKKLFNCRVGFDIKLLMKRAEGWPNLNFFNHEVKLNTNHSLRRAATLVGSTKHLQQQQSYIFTVTGIWNLGTPWYHMILQDIVHSPLIIYDIMLWYIEVWYHSVLWYHVKHYDIMVLWYHSNVYDIIVHYDMIS